ncbi:MAG: discoidin domain-containing protein [Sedimentisphaerales bacterium]|nr:discoidin domain-containing protein [Sedimentisphaerales bacterium]
MYRKLAYLIAASLVLLPGAGVQAAVWNVSFTTPHDFLANGVEGTGWDGFIGLGPQETADAINTSIDREGQLYLQSTGSFWEGAFNPRGPFLYKVVEGDFVATAHVTDFPGMPGSVSGRTTHADSFIMARVANLDDAGGGEDFVATHYFPTWSGNLRRNINDGGEQEQGATNDGFNCATWLQLERTGNVFTFRRSFDGETWTTIGGNNGTITRDDMDGLPVQVGMAQCMYITNTGYVAIDVFTLEGPNISPPGEAYNPNPSNSATDIVRDKVLSWTGAETAVSHDVYFGPVAEDVAAATRANPLGVLVSQGQSETTYTPEDLLSFGQTYYWRIDEVEADGAIRTGNLWEFTAEPRYYPIENVTATASGFAAGSGPENTVDESGLNANDQHSDKGDDMWQVPFPANRTEPVWIQFEFDKVYKLYDLFVWNGNPQFELYLNFSIKDVTIEYAVDANEWMTLGDYTLAKGSGLPSYTYNTTIDFGGVLAKYVRMNVNSNYGGGQVALSEVRFFQMSGTAREPQPASGAVNVDPDVVLSWRTGREAALHEVQFSTDSNTVAEGNALVDTVAETSYAPAALELGQTYYWRIDEVNEAETPATWEGEVWNFSTPEFLVVEDFESYTDDAGNLIYETWVDGFGVAGNGSQVGHDNPPYAERDNVHSGRQAMPLSYGLDGATTSEAVRTFAGPQNWTGAGVQTLVLFVRGNLGNPAGQLYVKINGTRFDFPGSTASLAAPIWKQWNIDLASLGNAAKNVTSLTIGVAGSGKGLLYVDDLRLYRSAGPMAEPPVDPGTANLVALYTMENSVADASGNGRDGTALTGASFGDGPLGYGRALVLDGTSGYAELPIGTLIQSLSSASFATWVNWSGNGGLWQRVFDFGTGDAVNMWLTPNASGQVRFAITLSGSGGESRLNRPGSNLSTGWHHVAVTIDGTTSGMNMYIDGNLVASNTTNVLPMNLGNTTQNWLGRSQYTGDAYFNGSIDDFRIYNRALSGPEVRYLVGDR